MLNEFLPLLHGPPRKSFRSQGSPEASVPVRSAGMRKTLREGKRVREGPGNQAGRAPHGGTNARPGREGRARPSRAQGPEFQIPDPKSRTPGPGPEVPASPQPPPPARAHCRPPPAIGRFERAWRCVPDVRREPAAAGRAGSCSPPLPGQWRVRKAKRGRVPQPGCRYRGAVAQTPAVERGERVLLPRMAKRLIYPVGCYSPGARHGPELGAGGRSSLGIYRFAVTHGGRRGCPVRTRAAESSDQSPVAPSPSPRLPPKHSEKQKKKSPRLTKLSGKCPSSPSREKGSEPPPAPARADGRARLGFPAGNEIRSKNSGKTNPRRYESFWLSRASIPGPSRPGRGAPPVPGSPSGTRDRGGKCTNEA
ncbi:basic salivary proline-rich protein 1-like [Pyrgilauda ruficollis]|uniref:basic salivary proline-rich protein 1-like n=1 Tax=Pyrgilauda ruficollis TaxID=221976 RepID=UPI001B863C7F|nr:basic salivary proline-rich protein 1-like [Pyrgilauda ruficollis]